MKADLHLMIRLFSIVVMLIPIIMTETRSAVLITRIAQKLRKETGDSRYRARVEDQRVRMRTLIFISCTRPLREFYFAFSIEFLTFIP